ncbi:MAG: NAD(P)H-hydrate dehydratase [Proteobacteria bacterium]|nr:NAD(P)H-hydrate dehydratase [Pseudomonadota bacterium]MBU4298061.1 NAD(P)H-hydrate dehydratase [Pseudomonadota bacterium]
MKLARAEQMRQIDRTAIDDIGIPGSVLMENAGQQTVHCLCRYFGEVKGKKIAVFAGPGNNGGDGFVVARHLQQLGAQVRVFLLVGTDRIKGDAAIHFRIISNLHIAVNFLLGPDDLQGLEPDSFDLIIDALFGTGLQRQIEGHYARVIEMINRASCPVVAVDMPSGLDSDTGAVCGVAVKADLTVTFGVAKPGHFVFPGREMVGELEVVDIGIPSQVVAEAGLTCEVLDRESAGQFVARRPANSHKGTYGHLLVVAGSIGKTGAAILCCQGALRSGAGLVSLCAARALNAIFESALHEAMTIPMTGSDDGAPSIKDVELILAALEGKQAAVVGPGLGTADETAELVKRIYQQADMTLLVDADAINILAVEKSALTRAVKAPRILTPHPGEMARLLGKSSLFIQQNRLETARQFAEQHNVYLVLKGAGTIVAAPDGNLAVNASGNPGMAAGGMGDVLSGIIGGLLAQGLEPWSACCLGVYVHGLAADRLAEKGPCGYLAGEVAERVPSVINELLTVK